MSIFMINFAFLISLYLIGACLYLTVGILQNCMLVKAIMRSGILENKS